MKQEMKILAEGENIVLVLNGKRVCDMPVQVGREMLQVLSSVVKSIEEIQNVAQIVRDQAILQRSGFPIGVTSNPKMQDDARVMSLHDRELRRAIPLRGIESQAKIGTPTLRRG